MPRGRLRYSVSCVACCAYYHLTPGGTRASHLALLGLITISSCRLGASRRLARGFGGLGEKQTGPGKVQFLQGSGLRSGQQVHIDRPGLNFNATKGTPYGVHRRLLYFGVVVGGLAAHPNCNQERLPTWQMAHGAQ